MLFSNIKVIVDYFKKILIKILLFKALNRRLILLIIDSIMLQISFYMSIWISNYNLYSEINNKLTNIDIHIFTLCGIFIYISSGQYKSLTRFITSSIIYKFSIRNIFLIISIFICSSLFMNKTINLSLAIQIWFLSTGLTALPRFLMRDLIYKFNKTDDNNKTNIAIFGAGRSGVQLYNSLRRSNNKKVIYFIDDDLTLKGRNISDIPIINLKSLEISNKNINQIFIAVPSISNKRLSEILEISQMNRIAVLKIPSLEDITSGKEKITQLKPISPDDLLGRKSVKPDYNLLRKSLESKTICITGAAGSIGSELCRQLIKIKPKKILIIDNSEPNLYEVQKELSSKNLKNIETKFILMDVTNKNAVSNLFIQEKIDIIFHAAAYKHVPLLESNAIAGIYNNVFSTKILCEICFNLSIKKFILISSDKAVRPTNIMGATKRLSELIVQAYASKVNTKTCFSMVRFGNVLGSSGSVIPLFNEQIKKGVPITLTHKKMIRYFMTIKEAAQLVMQASELATGGEVFLLDMGQPVKIYELAKQMITINGLSIKDKNNPRGDIEIQVIGLRPGEKLYEELLINSESIKTSHPLIFKGKESFLSEKILFKKIEKIRINIENYDLKRTLSLLKELVPEWENKKPNS